MVVLAAADRRGQRRFEQVITAMLAVVVVGFVAGLVLRPPDPGATLAGLVPAFGDSGSVLLAAGMLGATVMPHAIYLHSSLARDRHGRVGPAPERARLLFATKVDVTVALVLAGAANLALVLLGAPTLAGAAGADTLEGVHAGLGRELGAVAALLFAVALLFSGLASTSVGCYAGSVVMGGLLGVRMPLLVRRVVTAVPAVVVIAAGVDPTRALILSQVVLSFGIPFALIPLVVLTSRRSVMGAEVNGRVVLGLAVAATVSIVALNLVLLALVA